MYDYPSNEWNFMYYYGYIIKKQLSISAGSISL